MPVPRFSDAVLEMLVGTGMGVGTGTRALFFADGTHFLLILLVPPEQGVEAIVFRNLLSQFVE